MVAGMMMRTGQTDPVGAVVEEEEILLPMIVTIKHIDTLLLVHKLGWQRTLIIKPLIVGVVTTMIPIALNTVDCILGMPR